MDRPVSQIVDEIVAILGIRKVKKSQRKIINSFVRLLYFLDQRAHEFKSCPLSETELSILTTYYLNSKNTTEILAISERALRGRMSKIRDKLKVRNNIEAICIARENNWIQIEEINQLEDAHDQTLRVG